MNEPLWWKLLNVDADQYEKSAYCDPNSNSKFRMKDAPGVLRKLAPGLYEAAAGEVKEYSDFLDASSFNRKQVKLGKKVGSIPMVEACLRPELMTDKKAQDAYFKEHPEMKVKHPKKYV